jgi:hypothetical protein
MVGKLILKGIIIGLIAGLLAFAYAKTFGEPAVSVALGVEKAVAEQEAANQRAHGVTPAPEGPEMFSRAIQTGPGLLTGLVGVGAGIGAIFGVLFALGNGRMGLGPKGTAALLAAVGLVTVYVVPALKYPAAPPSVGSPETIKLRTGLYFLIMAISVACTVGSLMFRKNLIPKFGAWNASLIALAVYLVAISAFFLIMPVINEVPAMFPAYVLWDFRIASLGIQTILWGSVGILFGYFGAPSSNANR